jgi:hypothetical protein
MVLTVIMATSLLGHWSWSFVIGHLSWPMTNDQ